MTSAIHCHKLIKKFGPIRALDEFEFEVSSGDIAALLGPSGCGKTTALRAIAGFIDPDDGMIAISERTVFDAGGSTPPERRRVGMVFQEYALFPHMTVAANIGYGLGSSEQGRVADALEMVGLAGMADRYPHELSGGEQQRVALARALAPQPEVILLDEPFSNLDAGLRERMRRDVKSILRDAEATAVFVTHDQEEALAIADVVAVMHRGRIVQSGTPVDLYRRPRNSWVAAFVGDAQFIAGFAEKGRLNTSLGAFPHHGGERGQVRVMVRPEWVHPVHSTTGTTRVTDIEFYGHDQLIIMQLEDGTTLNARTGAGATFDIGDTVDVGIDELVVFESA